MVTAGLAARPADQREGFLRALMAHTAGAMVQIMGEPGAAESLYRTADAVVARAGRHG
jgi:hypothetical protein